MTDTTTQAVTALLDGVTPGPWVPHSDPCHFDTVSDVYGGEAKAKGGLQRQLMVSVGGYAEWQEQEANTRFIAAARDLVPALLAERDALAAQLAAAEARARESALEALAAYGQAAEAHEAQLAAEAKLATALEALADLVSWFGGGPSSYGPWIIASGDHGADDAVAVARALAKGGE